MSREKAAIFAGMRADYVKLKESWSGYSGYDEWFDGELNNAKLMAIATYQAWVPAFRRLLAHGNGDLDRFYENCRLASRLPPAERDRWLAGWRDAAIGGY
jgi:predicted aminopeptidase